MTINTQTGIHTGIAAGDTYSSIEAITGSNFSDVFVGDAGANIFNGGTGLDLLSFASESSGITLDLSAPLVTGVAAGDSYTSIEIFQELPRPIPSLVVRGLRKTSSVVLAPTRSMVWAVVMVPGT